jgi:anti-sigma B factor antagonist
MSTQPRRRRLEVEDIGDVAVVNFTDKKILDEQNIQVIGEQLFSLVDELGRKKILLNFRNVEYLSSAALGKFITLNKKVNGSAGKLILCNIDPQIYEVFEITKLNKLFNIQKDEQTSQGRGSARAGLPVRRIRPSFLIRESVPCEIGARMVPSN